MLNRLSVSVFALLAFIASALAQAPSPVQDVQQYPAGAIPISASATGTTGAIAATLAASTTKRTFICGFSYTGTNPTAATATSVTVTGVVTGTLSFGYPTLAAGATVPHPGVLAQYFFPCIPSSAINTAIAVNGPALGAGATLVTAAAWGYQQ